MSAGSLAQAAQAWVAQGAAIFPLMPNTKVPYKGTSGFKDARRDASPWQDGTPHNIGFLPASMGLVAIDVDQPLHWDDAKRWGLLAEPTFEVATPKGRHFYFRGIAPSNGCPVDSLIVRAASGYTVLPPSATPDGPYEALNTPADAIALPPAFAARLASQASSTAARERVTEVFSGRRITEGGRHPALCTMVGHLAAHQIALPYAMELVHAWNAQYCDPPKDAREVTKLVTDIYAKEERRIGEASAHLLVPPTELYDTTPSQLNARRRSFRAVTSRSLIRTRTPS